MSIEKGRVDSDFIPNERSPKPLTGSEGLKSGGGFGGRGRIPLTAIGASGSDGDQTRELASPKNVLINPEDVLVFSLMWGIDIPAGKFDEVRQSLQSIETPERVVTPEGRLAITIFSENFEQPTKVISLGKQLLHGFLTRSQLTESGKTFLGRVSRYSWITGASPVKYVSLKLLGIDLETVERIVGADLEYIPGFEGYPLGIFELGSHLRDIEMGLLNRHTQITRTGGLALEQTEEGLFHQQWKAAVRSKYVV